MSVRACTYRGKLMYGNVLAPKIICQPLQGMGEVQPEKFEVTVFRVWTSPPPKKNIKSISV